MAQCIWMMMNFNVPWPHLPNHVQVFWAKKKHACKCGYSFPQRSKAIKTLLHFLIFAKCISWRLWKEISSIFSDKTKKNATHENPHITTIKIIFTALFFRFRKWKENNYAIKRKSQKIKIFARQFCNELIPGRKKKSRKKMMWNEPQELNSLDTCSVWWWKVYEEKQFSQRCRKPNKPTCCFASPAHPILHIKWTRSQSLKSFLTWNCFPNFQSLFLRLCAA